MSKKPRNVRILSETDKDLARYLAMAIRNHIEDFHVEHLSDEEMRELNPLIRDAIATALHATRLCRENKAAYSFFWFQCQCIPEYWEEPKLTDDFLETIQFFEDNPSAHGFEEAEYAH